MIGLKQYSFDDDYQEERIEDGKKMIETYKIEKLLLLGNRKSYQNQTKKKILPELDK